MSIWTQFRRSKLFKFLSSLKLAVVIILSLASVLSLATVLESLYGMRAAHVIVYGAWWFHGLLFLLGTNVFFAAWSRYPWKRHQTGFVVTHTGILTLLLGAWMTYLFGVDGSLPIQQGTADNRVVLNALELTVQDPARQTEQSFPIPESAFRKKPVNMKVEFSGGEELVLDEFLPRVVAEEKWFDSPLQSVGSPRIQLRLESSRFDLEESLVSENPDKPTTRELGPAVLSFQKLWRPSQDQSFQRGELTKPPPEPKLGNLMVQFDSQMYSVDVAEAQKKWVRIGVTPVELQVDKYLPYAIVRNGELVSKSNEPANPAVQVRTRSGGQMERHTVFAQFPEFETLHGKSLRPSQNPLPIRLRYLASHVPGAQPAKRGRLWIAQSSDDKHLYFRSYGTGGVLRASGEMKLGAAQSIGWMDAKVTVNEWTSHGIRKWIPRYVEQIQQGGESSFISAAQYVVRRPGSETTEPGSWIFEGSSQEATIAGQRHFIRLDRHQLSLPFGLRLEKFEIGRDPGTEKAASYQSEVKVVNADGSGGEGETRTISMNQPLYHGGYTFYQASYQEIPGKPPLSVFSVNFDPGRWVKYLGSLLMVLGIVTMFYMNPQYWDILLGSRRLR